MSEFNMSKEATLRNTFERVQRIENFKVKVRLIPLDNEMNIGLEFSEPIVTDEAFLVGLEAIGSKMVNKYGDGALNLMSKKMTSSMMEALMLCRARFEDETELSAEGMLVSDDEVVYFGEEGLVHTKPNGS